MFLTLGLCSGTLIGIVVMFPYVQQLTDDRNYWYDQHSDLSQDIDDLIDMYNDLSQNYNDLFGRYQSLLNTLENPLTSPVLPTLSEVQIWLYTDDTDELIYTSNWMCGDFAAMLMVRAKEMNWRMRISCMFYSFIGNTTYGSADPYGAYGHAFNVIEVQDYDSDGDNDWVYIEPQTDQMWLISYGSAPIDTYTHYRPYSYFSGGLSGTVWYTNYWVNHYSYFA